MQNVKILVVEDEAITAMDIQKQLQKMGYLVPSISDNGEDAIRVAKEEQPNVILMDIVLKGEIDGTKAAHEISKTYNVPIIFLTAYKDEDSFTRAKASKPYGYLSKPYDIRDLRNAIELALFKHRAEAQISAAEQRYRSVLENATCGIIITNESGVISDANKQAEKITGCEKQKLIGLDLMNFIAPADKHYVEVQSQKLFIEKVIGPAESQIQQLDGALRDVEFTAVYVENDGEHFIFSILNDVTEKKRLLAKTQLSDKLATVGTLAAGIIHEINNPLTFIMANLDYMNELLEKEKNQFKDNAQQSQIIAKFHDVIDESIQGTTKIHDIVRNLKGFARNDQDDLDMVDLHEVMKVAISMAQPQFKHHAQLKTSLTKNLPVLILNANKLQQVFLNLIINASQAMEDGEYENNIIEIKTYSTDTSICFDVSDNGKGISPDVLPKIFDPFFTTKPAGVGTGLGLSICYDIIHSMGGKIDVLSVQGKGTTFTVALPMNLIIDKFSLAKPSSSAGALKRVLVIDDDPTMLFTLVRILGKHYHVTKAHSGREACDLLANNMSEFDMVISDLYMPDVNGADIYRYIEKTNSQLASRTLLISGGSSSGSMNEFLHTTKITCIEKPFSANQLIQAIEERFKQA